MRLKCNVPASEVTNRDSAEKVFGVGREGCRL